MFPESMQNLLAKKFYVKPSKDRYSMLIELQNYGVMDPEETSAVMWPKPILLKKKKKKSEPGSLKGSIFPADVFSEFISAFLP